MKFKSKSALAEHIKDLVKSGYLIPSWLTETSDDAFINQKTRQVRIYKVNYKTSKTEVDK